VDGMRKMNTYIAMNRKWMIRHIIADFMRAKNMFSNTSREFQAGRSITFENLKKLSDVLFEIKENLYLIYKRPIDPKTMRFEETDKITPNSREIAFMNYVGLLFHKTLVARELKYVMDHYTIDSTDYVNSNISLGSYFEKIQSFFISGADIIKELFRDYSDNEPLLHFVLENERYVQDFLNEKVSDLLKTVFGETHLARPYVQVGKYCLDSGWNDRAKKVLMEAVRLDSEDVDARTLLAQAKSGLTGTRAGSL
jgi:hypothetical protein